jgi:plasmid stabilization system protein ParE
MGRLPVEIHPSAIEEAHAAYHWYRERNEIVAKAFLSELDNAVEHISDEPLRWSSYIDRTRRFLLRKFPFSIIYRHGNETVQILAIAHERRKPGYWKKRKA